MKLGLPSQELFTTVRRCNMAESELTTVSWSVFNVTFDFETTGSCEAQLERGFNLLIRMRIY